IPAIIVAQDAVAAKTVLTNLAKAMGVENLKTIQFSGMGSNSGIGQNVNPKLAWPVARLKIYTRKMDFSATAFHTQLVRVQGGADQTQNEYISSDSPWDSQFKYWLTPFGFNKGAMANNASVKSEAIGGTKYNVVSFTLQNK